MTSRLVGLVLALSSTASAHEPTDRAVMEPPVHVFAFSKDDHRKAAPILNMYPAPWLALVEAFEAQHTGALFTEKLERIEMFLVAWLVRASLDEMNDFTVGWRTRYYKKHELLDHKQERPARDALTKYALHVLSLPSTAAPSWGEEGVSRLGPNAATAQLPTPHRMYLPDPALREKAYRLYEAIIRLNDLPRSSMTIMAIESLLELEGYATDPSKVIPTTPFTVGANGIKIDPKDSPRNRRALENWILRRHREVTGNHLPGALAHRTCEGMLGFTYRWASAKIQRRW